MAVESQIDPAIHTWINTKYRHNVICMAVVQEFDDLIKTTDHKNLINYWHTRSRTLNMRCKPHLTRSGLHTIIHRLLITPKIGC